MKPKQMTTTTASLIPTKNSPWLSLRETVEKEIMNTDVLCEVLFLPGQEPLAHADIEAALNMMRSFETRYSRFKTGNDLWKLNTTNSLQLTPEFFHILETAQKFHHETQGLFDPSILPLLEKEGYPSQPYHDRLVREHKFSELLLDKETLVASKPASLLIDLGGIGKGYIVDQVVDFLKQHFDNFLVDAGGDIFAKGSNKKESYPYWAIEVEHPLLDQSTDILLLLTDMAVATSGRNRRNWKKNGQEKHHLIHPDTEQSSQSDLLSVTVVAPSTVEADIWAKTLFLLGSDKAEMLAEQKKIPAIFIKNSGQVISNPFISSYVWN